MSLETRNISRKVFRKCPVTVRNQWERKQHVQPQVVDSETGDPESLGVRSVGGAEGGPHDDHPPPGVATPAPRSQGLGPRPGQTGAWTSSKVSCYWSLLPVCHGVTLVPSWSGDIATDHQHSPSQSDKTLQNLLKTRNSNCQCNVMDGNKVGNIIDRYHEKGSHPKHLGESEWDTLPSSSWAGTK